MRKNASWDPVIGPGIVLWLWGIVLGYSFGVEFWGILLGYIYFCSPVRPWWVCLSGYISAWTPRGFLLPLSEIYVLALSEPPLQRVSSEKDAQSCPETGISTLVRGREFRSLIIKKNTFSTPVHKSEVDIKGSFLFCSSFSTCLQRGPFAPMPVHKISRNFGALA